MGLKVVETVAGIWYFHLREEGQERTLCGRRDVMATGIPLNAWGKKSDHLPEKFCKECDHAKSAADTDERRPGESG